MCLCSIPSCIYGFYKFFIAPGFAVDTCTSSFTVDVFPWLLALENSENSVLYSTMVSVWCMVSCVFVMPVAFTFYLIQSMLLGALLENNQ